MRRLTLPLFLLFPLFLWAQTATVTGRISDQDSDEPLIGASVLVDAGQGTITDVNGRYTLELPPGSYDLTVSYVGYDAIVQSIELQDGERLELDYSMISKSTVLETATISSGRYKKPLGEVTVSLDILQTSLIENTSKQTLDQAIEKVPGVQVIDRQANIRGGSGFSNGAGSRVLLLVDDIPILQPDAGFPNWDDLPMEIIDQVEVIKGAASSLYGSSAMNGIINVRTAFPASEPETKVSIFNTFFLNPRNPQDKWWDFAPYSFTTNFSHRRKIKKFDLVLGGFYLTEQNFERNADRHIGRFSFATRYRITDRITVGINGNFNGGERSTWFYWAADTSRYEGDSVNFVTNNQRRFNIDPHVTIFDRAGNRHRLLARYYDVDNNITNNQANSSRLWYTEYQFQRKFQDLDMVLSTGFVYIGSTMTAQLYGDTTFQSRNLAGYVQLDKKFFNRLNLSAGFRYEQNKLVNPGFIYPLDTVPPSTEVEAKPVFRFGANYQMFEQTYVRGSWGQGYRYPTLTERYIFTNVGGFNVVPNPELQSETGWSAELAIKQGFRVGTFDGYFDIAAFIMRYQDMMEFNIVNRRNTFGVNYQSTNIGDTEIRGVEFSTYGTGTIGRVPINFLAGYMYIDPRFEQFDTTPAGAEIPTQAQVNAINSTSPENVLKYRNQHQFKFDVEAQFGRFNLGVEAFYFSRITAIDFFLQLAIPGFDLDPDSKEAPIWRDINDGYFLLNPRASYRISDWLKASVVLNNVLNEEYSVRPGRLGAPRNIIARLDFDL